MKFLGLVWKKPKPAAKPKAVAGDVTFKVAGFHEFGTVAAGQRANLVITNGDVLQASTQVLSVFIDGRPYEPANKQTRLYDRYRQRLDEVKSGRAPLGTDRR